MKASLSRKNQVKCEKTNIKRRFSSYSFFLS